MRYLIHVLMLITVMFLAFVCHAAESPLTCPSVVTIRKIILYKIDNDELDHAFQHKISNRYWQAWVFIDPDTIRSLQELKSSLQQLVIFDHYALLYHEYAQCSYFANGIAIHIETEILGD